jgi:hypothetical protein
MRRLFIIARDKALRHALRDYISLTGIGAAIDDGPDLFSFHPSSGGAVLTPAPEMSPGTAAYLKSGQDMRVLVLAPIPTDLAKNEYERHGAA